MENNDAIIAQNGTDISTVNVVGIEELSIDNLYEVKKQKATNHGEMIMFEDFRIGLGGADNKWGRKVFFKSMMDIGLLELCADRYKMVGDIDKDVDTFLEQQQKKLEGELDDGTYCPTSDALGKYFDVFSYDKKRNMWGLSRLGLPLFEEEILPVLARRADKVREMVAEQKRLRAAALRAVQSKGKDTLF